MERDAILERILSIFKESRETYGCPRMYDQLAREGYKCSYNTVERIMKANGVRPRHKSKVKRTTDSRHEHPIAANVLDRDFKASTPDEVWVSDISVPRTRRGGLHVEVNLFEQRCCIRDGGGSSGVGLPGLASNNHKRLRLRVVVVNVVEKALRCVMWDSRRLTQVNC